MQFREITIAVPKEIMPGERRVAVTAETVKLFTEQGAKVLIETGAGAGSYIEDSQYRNAGAIMTEQVAELYAKADIILKVKEPRFNERLNLNEAELIPDRGILVCFLHPANRANHETVQILARKGVTSFTLDGIPRISSAQRMDPLTTMSTVAGYKAVIIAANQLLRFIPMMPTAFGVIQPAKFVVVGVGVAGLQAIATAKRLGAKVKALDIRPEAREQVLSLGAELIPFEIPLELAVEKGGYACRLPEEWYIKEREALRPHLQDCDAMILSALVPGEEAPMLVDESMVKMMKKGSCIVDIAVDQGGNCELTQCGQEYTYEGITISGIANIPASLAIDSTWMFAQNVLHFLNHVVSEGKVITDTSDPIVGGTLVTVDNRIVHRGTLLSMKVE